MQLQIFDIFILALHNATVGSNHALFITWILKITICTCDCFIRVTAVLEYVKLASSLSSWHLVYQGCCHNKTSAVWHFQVNR